MELQIHNKNFTKFNQLNTMYYNSLQSNKHEHNKCKNKNRAQ